MSTDKHRIQAENAAMIAGWLKTRAGIAIWGCLDLGNAGQTWTTPVNGPDGNPVRKPHWSATNEPIRLITDIADVEVETPREVKRFHVGVERGDGFQFVLTDAATRKVEAAVKAAGEDAWYVFDYSAQDAVILVADKVVPLSEVVNG